MIREGDVLLNFIELVGVRNVNRVFLSVQSIQLQSVVNFGEVHRSCDSAASAEELNVQRVVRYTKNNTGKVFRSVDRLLGVRDFTEGSCPLADCRNAHGINAVHKSVACFAVQVVKKLCLIVEHIRYGNNIEAGLKACINRSSKNQHLKRACGELLDTCSCVAAVERTISRYSDVKRTV